MAWGTSAAQGIEDWLERLQDNDRSFTSLQVFRSRKFGLEVRYGCLSLIWAAVASSDNSEWVKPHTVTQEVKQLCQALQRNTCLNNFSSSGLPASTEAAEQFAAMLGQNKGLRSLGIGDAQLGDQALAQLAGGLKNNSTLEALEMEHKGITAAGAKSLAEGLSGSSLKRLCMARNELGDEGGCCFKSIATILPRSY